MALFWILVQQVCMSCIKWVYEDIAGRTPRRARFLALNACFFAALIAMALDPQFGFHFISGNLPPAVRAIYPRLNWNFFCYVMLLLDGLLVLYGWRIYRLYMAPAPVAPRPGVVLAQDALLVGAFTILFAGYHAGMIETVLHHTVRPVGIFAMQFFFVKIANFFYAAFEGILAVLLWRIYRRIRVGRDIDGRI